MRKEEQAFVDAVSTEYSYAFAKSMEQFKTNEVLGYRTAGSVAEWQTGELIKREMEAIGLVNVRKDEIGVDSWEFKRASMRYRDEAGVVHGFELGAYQTEFHTGGFKPYELVDVGKGRERDYKGLDVSGKLVLARINQREEWWINFPVYQAYLKGAAGLIAVQEGGFGEVDRTALNAQDIGGPAKAAAFSMSRTDADVLREVLEREGSAQVEFFAESTVENNGRSYNIIGEIPGKDPDSMILVSAHYDSYFSGFQDDNAAVGMMLGIGKALVDSGYRPEKTVVFCGFAAEEWGLQDSKYDWSTGAYKQVFEVCPQWQGNAVADLNFELPAHGHSEKDWVRCVTEYADFIRRFLKDVKPGAHIYPKGIGVRYPIQTMSDDFSMAIGGIPSMVNEFTSAPFMETHYHSQFDTESYYQEEVYRYHHELYGRLLMAFDRTVLPPFQFADLFETVKDSVDLEFSARLGARGQELLAAADAAMKAGRQVYRYIRKQNREYEKLLDGGLEKEAEACRRKCRKAGKTLMKCFKKAQDSFVRLNWHDEVLFPQEAVRENLYHIRGAAACLEEKDVRGALASIYQIDNNRYAFLFEEEVFRHFTDYIMEGDLSRLQWGAGRIVHHENLYHLVQQLKEKVREEVPDLKQELEDLKRVEAEQASYYRDDVDYMIGATEKITAELRKICDQYSKIN